VIRTAVIAATLIAAVGFARTFAQQSDVPQRECEVLMALYAATGGERWTQQAGWSGD